MPRNILTFVNDVLYKKAIIETIYTLYIYEYKIGKHYVNTFSYQRL